MQVRPSLLTLCDTLAQLLFSGGISVFVATLPAQPLDGLVLGLFSMLFVWGLLHRNSRNAAHKDVWNPPRTQP